MAFRASLEVTSDDRCGEFSRRLLPWLVRVACGGKLDPIEREQLDTPLGELSDSQTTDVRWAGDSAAFLCWMLGLAAERDLIQPGDPTSLPPYRLVLRPEAVTIVESAAFGGRDEIEDTCRQFILALTELRASRVAPPANDIVRRLHMREMADVGLPVTEPDVERARRHSSPI